MNRTSNAITYAKAAALAAVAFVCFPAVAPAMPAPQRPVTMACGDGTFRQVLLHGDEHCHAVTTTDGTTLLRRGADGLLREAGAFDADAFRAELGESVTRRRRSSAPRRVMGNPTFPCHGKQRGIAILVEFPSTDKHPEGRRFSSADPRALFDRLLNADDYSDDGATGSVRSYFLDSSSGVFDITFDVYGPVTLERDLSFYCDKSSGEDRNAWHMVEEACRAVDAAVDFRDYDRDGDGMIDNVYIFYAGAGGATGGDPEECIWQHASDVELLSGQRHLFDGVRLNHYACSNEYRDVTDESGVVTRQTEGIGTVCHEFSHVLGLPDFYDVGNGGHMTPGVWSVMDQGCHLNQSRTPAAYSAIDRMQVGWLDPVDIGSEPRTLTLGPISDNQAYRIATADEAEFFLLENRQLTGWDAALPGHGLVLWRINYQADYWDANQVNTGRGTSAAVVVAADGSAGPSSYAGDPFPGSEGVTSIGDDGYPNMLSGNGDRTNAPLSNIVEAGGIITFDVCRAVTHLEQVEGLRASDVTPTAFTAEWNALPMSPGYVLNVYTRSGDVAEPVGIYSDLSVAGTSVRVSGLQPSTDYYFTVRGVAGAVSGAASEECAVTTPAMSFRFMAPQVNEPTEVGSDSFRASWEPMEHASDYVLTVCSVQAGPDRHATADFTGGIEALAAGWSTNCIATMSLSGYYGQSAPSLSMGADYARLQSPLLARELKSIDFWYRERTPSGKSRLEISVLSDGNWSEIDRVELPASMPEGVRHSIGAEQLPAGAVAVRLVYRRVEKGTLALDDVRLRYRGEDESTPLADWNERVLGSSDTHATVSGLEPNTAYSYSVRGVHVDDGTMSAPSEYVSVTTTDVNSSLSGAVDDLLPRVRVAADGTVSVDGADDFTVYDVQGRPAGRRLAARGVYLLRVNNHIVKIIC